MGNVRIDLANVVTIGLVAFLSVYAINRGLEKINMGAYKA